LEKTVSDATRTTVKVADALIKKAWSVLEAASEKKEPKEYLTSQAIRNIQGKLKS
jgi:hypothetical protein